MGSVQESDQDEADRMKQEVITIIHKINTVD